MRIHREFSHVDQKSKVNGMHGIKRGELELEST